MIKKWNEDLKFGTEEDREREREREKGNRGKQCKGMRDMREICGGRKGQDRHPTGNTGEPYTNRCLFSL